MEFHMTKIGPLANKPLAEAIFEIRWQLNESDGALVDPAWDFLPGLLFTRLKDRFPCRINLPAAAIPPGMVPHTIRHQFRSSPDGWPVIQLGPGILTVNQTDDYGVWSDFSSIIAQSLESLFAVYPSDLPQPIQIDLRYINAIAIDLEKHRSVIGFLRQYLHVDVQVTAALFEAEEEGTEAREFDLTLTYPIRQLGGVGALSFSLGRKGPDPALIWQIVVQSRQPSTPQTTGAIGDWLNSAHTVIERWFLRLSEGELFDSFSRTEP